MRRLDKRKRTLDLLSLHKLFGYAAAALFLTVQGYAAINVTFSSAVPQAVQQEFISNTTGQYLSTVSKSPYFQNTFSIVILGKNPLYQPPPMFAPIATATAMDECFAHGYVFGMEGERKDDLKLISDLKDNLIVMKTCGGLVAGTTVATDAYLNGCWNGYNVATSTITQRDGLYPTVILNGR